MDRSEIDGEAHHQVRAALHAAAEAHQPDRAAMLARVAGATREPPSPRSRRTWPRAAAAVCALALVLGLGSTTAR